MNAQTIYTLSYFYIVLKRSVVNDNCQLYPSGKITIMTSIAIGRCGHQSRLAAQVPTVYTVILLYLF